MATTTTVAGRVRAARQDAGTVGSLAARAARRAVRLTNAEKCARWRRKNRAREAARHRLDRGEVVYRHPSVPLLWGGPVVRRRGWR